jgi:hypothetical protein
MRTARKAGKAGFATRYRWPLILVGVILLVAGVAAWQYYDSRYPSWHEEVRLSDGRVITIYQKHEYYDNYGTNQSWVEIELPELGGKRVWHSHLIPQRVDVVQGKVYVFGAPRGDRQYYHYSDPKNFLVGFAWNGSEFARVPFLSIPESARQEENIYSCVPTVRSKVLTEKTKDDNWCPPKGDEGQFSRKINLPAFQEAAVRYSRRAGGKPSSD